MLNGVPAVYKRGAVAQALKLVQGNNAWDEAADGTVVQATRTQEFIMSRDSLGALFPPAAGDEIKADGRVYGVMSPQGEQAWRYCGRSGNWLRVFSKQIGVINGLE